MDFASETLIATRDVAGTLSANGRAAGSATQQDAHAGLLIAADVVPPVTGNPYGDHESRDGLPVAAPLGAPAGGAGGFDASEDGSGRGTPLVVSETGKGFWSAGDTASALRAQPGGMPAHMVAHAFDARQSDVVQYGDRTGPLDTDGQTIGVLSVALRGREGGATAELGDDKAGTLRASKGGGDKPHVLAGMAVRRLTTRECERLQGLPDGHTLIPTRSVNHRREDEIEYLREQRPDLYDADLRRLSADGPRYKAIGNGMAVPVVRWIGRRLEAVQTATGVEGTPLDARAEALVPHHEDQNTAYCRDSAGSVNGG